MTDDEPHALVDRAVLLDAGWRLATTVNPDGTWWPWLLAPGPDAPQEACWAARARHEQLGHLPTDFTARLNLQNTSDTQENQ